ncbi:MAG: glycosyltransferase family 4 protein [Actinomycetota bacterium]|nr:glycosyltransferase family 4 protein [Actinomycetota bacterium]
MRVALDATPLLGVRTGVGHFAAEVLASLARRDGLELSAFALTWRGRDGLATALPPEVRPVPRPMAARPLREAWKRASLPPIEWWTGPIDVVHGTNFVVPPARRAAEVVTVHDLTAVRFPELCTADALELPRLVRRALARGAFVHTPSAFVAAELVELLGADPDRVSAVPLGVPAVEELSGGDPREGCRLAGSERYVLALGTVEPRKDLPTLVRAFDLVAGADADLSLVVAGPDGWGTEAFAAAVATARHGDRVRRLGYVGGSDKASLLSGAAVFAFPSINEGFGLPPLEAMAVGVPVVATDAGSLPEVLGEAARLVPAGDVEALAAALTAALRHDAAHDALVERGRRQARAYSWDRCAEGLIELYQRAAHGRSG